MDPGAEGKVDAWSVEWEREPEGRSYRLREMYWARTHDAALCRAAVAGCGDGSLVGHARDFAALLAASEPFIQPGELIVGCCLALPEDEDGLDLGYYNPHYPPGYALLLERGLPGIRDTARARLRTETDPEKREFLRAVAISYDAACGYVLKYARQARAMAAAEPDPARRADLQRIAAVCDELATAPPGSFHAALQLVQFTRLFGGHGSIGRFDQWLYPFYRGDVASGRLTPGEALELIECLFIKLNYFADVTQAQRERMRPITGVYQVNNDTLRNIALAGQTPDGRDACNELTYLCLAASAHLMLPEPKLNVRFFEGSPPRLLEACCRLLSRGANVLAVFNDEVVIPGLLRLGIPLEDARDYCNDGCSELIIGGKSTIRFCVHDALPLLNETVMRAKGRPFSCFKDVIADYKSRLTRFMPRNHGRVDPVTFPYFAATIEDCLDRASPSGVRYCIHGSILAQVGNVADGLAAIQKLIYQDRALTWGELAAALRADFEGYEPLRQMLRNRAPKYGNDVDGVDAIAREIAEWFCDGVHARASNPRGRGPKRAAGLMCFGIQHKRHLPASVDGRRQGDPTASSFSPAVGMDRSGPTAVLRSVSKVDLTKASHGSVLDLALHTSVMRGQEALSKLAALIGAFLSMRGTATLQVNVIDREALLRARADPTAPEYRTLIVRVWGFSAVFVELPEALQDHVLARTEHGLS